MPGTAVVTINENQWNVEVASTPTELITGLAGRASIPAGTGMLFILPATQIVTVDTNQMLFLIDIIFIKDGIVLSIARNIEPGYLVEEATPIDMFLEVNADEAELVEAGNVVTIEMAPTEGFNISNIIAFAIPLALLGFVCAMAGGVMKSGGSSSSSEVRRLGKPRTEEERARVHEEFYGTKELPARGKGLKERGELAEGRRLGEPKTEEERRETHERKYGTKGLPERGKGLEKLQHSAKHPEYVQSASSITSFISDAADIGIEAEKEAEEAATSMRPIDPRFYGHFDLDIRKVKELASRSAIEYGVAGKGIMDEYLPQTLSSLESIIKDLHSLDEAIYRSNEDTASDKWGDIEVMAWRLARLQDEAVIDVYERLSGGKVYGTKELPQRGKGLEERGESTEGGYYWEIVDIDTGEIMQKGKPYTTKIRAMGGAESFQKGREPREVEHLVVIRIYDNPNMDEWGKTVKPVLEIGMHHGIPTEIGKTPLQKEALDRLWPYSILEIHSDGDLTIISSGKKYVVTTEGGVFGEETSLGLRPMTSEQHAELVTIYGEDVVKQAEEETTGKGYGAVSIKCEEIYTTRGRQSIHGEPRKRLVEDYGSWAVGRAEAICPEGDVACVTREAKRLIETLRSRYGEEAVEYVTITDAGATVFHSGDTISIIALERENRRVRELGEKEATYK